MGDTVKLFCCDLNWSKFDLPVETLSVSAAQDWACIDPKEYFQWHRNFGNNVTFCQAYTFGGYAFYPSRLGPTAPGLGSHLFPRLYELSREAGISVWSYFCVGTDVTISNSRDWWVVPMSRVHTSYGFLAPESPWTDLLVARIREFLTQYPVDWILFDWFVYGGLKPDFPVQPAWFVEKPFREIIGRQMPKQAEDITPKESLLYKREVLAQQFYRIRDAVKETSPDTKIIFNVPYWEPREPLWLEHPMMRESDGLFAECTREEVVEWLLQIRRPEQRVMTTVIGRIDGNECEPNSWRKWYERGCDLFGYAWGTPPDFRPHPSYTDGLAIVRQGFQSIP